MREPGGEIEGIPEHETPEERIRASKYFLERDIAPHVDASFKPKEPSRPKDLSLSIEDFKDHLKNPDSPLKRTAEKLVQQESSLFVHPETQFGLIFQAENPHHGYQFLVYEEGGASKLGLYEYRYDEKGQASLNLLKTHNLKPLSQDKALSVFEEISRFEPEGAADIWTIIEEEMKERIPNFLERYSKPELPTPQERFRAKLSFVHPEIGFSIYPEGTTDHPAALLFFSMGEISEREGGASFGSAVVPSSDIEAATKPALLGLHEHPAEVWFLPCPSPPDLTGVFPAHPGRTEAIFDRPEGRVRLGVYKLKPALSPSQRQVYIEEYQKRYHEVGPMLKRMGTTEMPTALYSVLQHLLDQLFDRAYFEFKNGEWREISPTP